MILQIKIRVYFCVKNLSALLWLLVILLFLRLQLFFLPLFFNDKLEFIIDHIFFLHALLQSELICPLGLASIHHLKVQSVCHPHVAFATTCLTFRKIWPLSSPIFLKIKPKVIVSRWFCLFFYITFRN